MFQDCSRGSYRSLAVIFTLALGVVVPQSKAQVNPTDQLKIQVVKGEGDTHRPGDKEGTQLHVQVLSELDLPLSDAKVTFESPATGAGASLEKGGAPLAVTTTSDAEGFAKIDGVYGNNIRGPYTIRVSASFEGKTGSAQINQGNDRGAVLTRTRATILASALAATGLILYLALRPGPPTATIGTPTSSTGGPQANPAFRFRIGR